MNEKTAFEGWAILEVMGHRRLGGYLREQEIAGHGFIRIDVPESEGRTAATQLYSPSSVYCITPTTEEIARAAARRSHVEPVSRWELLPEPEPRRRGPVESYAEYDDETDREDLPFG